MRSVLHSGRRDDGGPRYFLTGSEVEYQPVRPVETVGPRSPGVNFDHASLYEAHQSRKTIERQHRFLFTDVDALHHPAQARPRMLGEEAFFAGSGRAAQQAQVASSDVWKNAIGDVGIVVGQSLLGDARLRPQDAFRMGELSSARIGLVQHRRALAGEGGMGAFEADFLHRLVFPQTLERGLPDQSVVGPVAVFDRADEVGLGPHEALLGAGRQGVAQNRFRRLDLVEFGIERSREVSRPAGADAARVNPLAIGIIAERQCAHRAAGRRRGDVTQDHEFLTLLAFCLEPVFAASGPVWQVSSLGDDAFEAETTRMLQHGGSVGVKMFAETDRRNCLKPGDDALQQPLAIDERRFGEVVALAIQQIEDVVPEALPPAGFQIRLQIVEAGNALLILDDDFAVDQGRTDPKAPDPVPDAAKTRRPVERLAGEQPRLAPVDARLDSIAVVLDLVNPFWTARRLVAGRRETRLQEGRQQALAGARDLADVRQDTLSPARDGGARPMVDAQIACRREFLVGAAAELRGDFLIGDFRAAGLAGEGLIRLDEKPGLGLLPAPPPQSPPTPLPLSPPPPHPPALVPLPRPL